MRSKNEFQNQGEIGEKVPHLCISFGDCCGCTACYSVCPKRAIQMVEDDEGFPYPHVNENLCIGCHLCEKVCVFKRDAEIRKNKENCNSSEPLFTYAVRHRNEQVRMESRSGGIFTAVSDLVFSQGGVVYGCVLDDNFEALHIRASCAEERDEMRGSKYIQSSLNDTYREIKSDLDKDLLVLFSGTSCQVSGLKAFLEKEYFNLLCIDIVCHGVSSPLVWRKYLRWQEDRNNGKIVSVDFRNKREFGWRAHIETLHLQSCDKFLGENSHRNSASAKLEQLQDRYSSKIKLRNDVLSRPTPKEFFCKDDGVDTIVYSDIFTNLFYEHCILRPSCYQCPYKSLTHPGDITIGDYWGINLVSAAHLDDDRGVSLVMINTDKGKKMFDSVKKDIIAEETGVSQKMMQQPLRESFSCPDNRGQFWDDFHKLPFAKISRKYAKHSYRENIRLWLGCNKRTIVQKIKG